MTGKRNQDPTRRGLLAAGALLLGAGAVLVPSGPAWAKTARLELEVDLRELSVGQTVTARLRLVDGVVRGRPELPVGDGLLARFTGQSQQHVVVNFESTRIVEFSYAITARAEGRWSVGPAQLQLGSSTLTADAVTVTVRPPSAAEKAANDVVATVTDAEPYLGEVVVFRFRHRHADRVLDLDWTPPGFDGFVAEKTAEASQRDYQLDQDGVTYQVEEIFMPLVATAEGSRTIPPAVLTVRVPAATRRGRRSPFMGSVESRTMSSDPIVTRIRPLPTDGQPDDFSGLVGQFHLRAATRRESASVAADAGQDLELALGESVTLEITLSGDGTLAGVKLPPAPSDGGYRAYDDAPEVLARVTDGRFASVATFRRAIVPTREGSITVAPIELSVFDPERERYVRLRTEPLQLTVTPGEAGQGEVRLFGDGGGQTTDERAEVEALGEDILPVPGGVRVRDRSLASALPIAIGLPALPALGLVALLFDSLRRRRKPDPRAVLRASMSGLPSEPAARLGSLESAFREACALRLGRPAPGLDAAAVAALGQDAAAIYDALGRARYGGFTPGGDLEARILAFVEAT